MIYHELQDSAVLAHNFDTILMSFQNNLGSVKKNVDFEVDFYFFLYIIFFFPKHTYIFKKTL